MRVRLRVRVRVCAQHVFATRAANLIEQERQLGAKLIPDGLVVGERRVVHEQLRT